MKPRVKRAVFVLMSLAVVLIVVGMLFVENGFWLAMAGAFLAIVATFAVTVDANKRQ